MRKNQKMHRISESKYCSHICAQLLLLLLVVSTIFIAFISLAPTVSALPPDSFNFTSGSTYYAQVTDPFAQTIRWAGIKVIHNAISLSEGTLPFLSSQIITPGVVQAAFPGANHNDGLHYYIATEDSIFNITNMQNITTADIGKEMLFNSTEFPQFYTNFTATTGDNYYGKSDGPNATFCCNTTTILVGAINITVFPITLNYNYTYYLGKYNASGKEVPMFIAPHQTTLCYNLTVCYAEFIIPISPSFTWNFFSINSVGVFNFDFYVDSVLTTIIPQTAKPYNITVRAYNLYTGTIAPFTPVAIGEYDGQNIFVPYRLSGYVSRAYSVAPTNAQGLVSFVSTPTVYPMTQNYSFFVGAYYGGNPTSVQYISVNSANQLLFGSKNISPQTVYDNAKTSVNAMNQITSYLYRWTSVLEEAKTINITYDVGYQNYTVDLEPGNFTDFTMQTGIPYVISFNILNFTNSTTNCSGYILEKDGYLLLNPYTDVAPLPATKKYHDWLIPDGSQFIVVPTSLGAINSTIVFQIRDSQFRPIGGLTANISQSLSLIAGGVPYKNDLLKTVTNAINQVIHSLYIALNT